MAATLCALCEQDIEDLAQEVLAVVIRKLPEFQRRPQLGSFRRWLRSIAVNCLRDFWRAQRYRPRLTGQHSFGAVLDQLEDSQSALSKLWDREHDEHVTRHLLEKIRPRFEEKTWLAFQQVALQGIPVDEVARDLGMTANAVFIAKSRVVHQSKNCGCEAPRLARLNAEVVELRGARRTRGSRTMKESK